MSFQDHIERIQAQVAKGPTIGNRETPVVSFWPMRDKWKKYGDYWELWGTDGDVEPILGTEKSMAPAELRLIYFRIPGTETVCQLAYEHDPAEEECARVAMRRMARVEENIKQGLGKLKQVA